MNFNEYIQNTNKRNFDCFIFIFGYHVKKTWLPHQKDMATTSKRIVLNLIELSIQNDPNAADKNEKSLKAALQNARKKHLRRSYKKRKRKSRGSFG